MQIQITADTKKVQAGLHRLRKITTDKSAINRAIANLLEVSTRKRFRRQKSPDGRAWARNAPATIKAKGYRTNNEPDEKAILIGKTRVLSHIRSKYSKDTVVIGTSARYGVIHQFGGNAGRGRKVKIPARPFLGVSKSDQKAVLRLLQNKIRRAVANTPA